MSGHSKWSCIKRKKGASIRRGERNFEGYQTVDGGAREGGGDTNLNAKLRVIVDKAKAMNMPADSMNRAIKRGTGEIEGANLRGTDLRGLRPRRHRGACRGYDRKQKQGRPRRFATLSINTADHSVKAAV